MLIIHPIDPQIQQDVIAEVQRYIDTASSLYHQSFEPIDVVFDLRGKTAGMYRCHYEKKTIHNFLGRSIKQRQIRFNPWLFAKYFQDSWDNTIPHEVAHYVSDCLYDLRKIKPHGVEWKKLMIDFGAEPIVRANYDLAGIPVRQVRRYLYVCGCREVELTAYRHNKIQNGIQQYSCRHCFQPLVLKTTSDK